MWDERSGARERLYLLLRIGSSDPSPWGYDSHSDRWSNGTIGFKVGCEGEESRAILRTRGLTDGAIDALVRDGQGAGVVDPTIDPTEDPL